VRLIIPVSLDSFLLTRQNDLNRTVGLREGETAKAVETARVVCSSCYFPIVRGGSGPHPMRMDC
jgi:hypothetical protein